MRTSAFLLNQEMVLMGSKNDLQYHLS